MKNTGKCPKCGGADIYRVEGHPGNNTGNSLIIGMTAFSAIALPRYICTDCGYAEEWIENEDLPKLKAKLKKKS